MEWSSLEMNAAVKIYLDNIIHTSDISISRLKTISENTPGHVVSVAFQTMCILFYSKYIPYVNLTVLMMVAI